MTRSTRAPERNKRNEGRLGSMDRAPLWRPRKRFGKGRFGDPLAAAAAAAAAGAAARGPRGSLGGPAGERRAEDRKLDGGLFARAVRAGDLLVAVDDDLFKRGLAVVADVLVDGHGGSAVQDSSIIAGESLQDMYQPPFRLRVWPVM